MRGLDWRIDIQRRTVTQDDYGQEVESWTTVAARRAANVRPLSGDERYISAQFIARQQTEFRVRYSSDLANLNALDRVIYPAIDAGSPDEPGIEQIYDVVDVAEMGRHEAIRIIGVRREDVPNA
jgi:SPP1 family predicted phage head-tail adaptor